MDSFIRHKIEDNNIEKSYVGFKVRGSIYYLQGGVVDEGKNDPRPLYKANKEVLAKAFGSGNCSEITSDTNYDYYSCSNDSLSALAYSYGTVSSWTTRFFCAVRGVGDSYCQGH